MSTESTIKCPNCATEIDLSKAMSHCLREKELILLDEIRKLRKERQNNRLEVAMTLDTEREKVASKVHEALIQLSEREQLKLAEKDQIIGGLQQQINKLKRGSETT